MPRLLDPVVPAGTLRDREQPTLTAADDRVLRPFRPVDAVAVAQAYDDPDIRFWHHRSLDAEEAAAWIAASRDAWSREDDAEWAVIDGDRVVGRVALRGIDLAIGQAEVSYWTVPRARGTGHATAAVARLASWALHEVGLWRLTIRHSTRNPPSCAVARAAGFAHEATLGRCHLHADGWRDVHVHTRFRDEPTRPSARAAPGAGVPRGE